MNNYKRSPINYMGSKYRSLSYIIPNFPEHIDNFYDVFGGSGTISLNTRANFYHYNELMTPIKELMEYLSLNDPGKIIEDIDNLKLDLTKEEDYKLLRKNYNEDKDLLKLYALINHSFNYLIRFNKKEEFNASFGKGICKISQDILDKLNNYYKFTNENKIKFYNDDFRTFLNNFEFKENDFLYLDPPYELTEANYNENRGFVAWKNTDAEELLLILENLNSKNIKWGYSNMISNKGIINEKLMSWIAKNNFKVFSKEVSYNGVPSTRLKLDKSVEVFITNY